jgi:hypothetical protein
VWLTVRTTASTPPGDYAGQVRVVGDGVDLSLVLEVRVWDVTLPATPRLATAFDVYRGRIELAYGKLFPSWGRALSARGVGAAQIERQLFDGLLSHRLSPILNLIPDDPLQLRLLDAWGARLSAFSLGPYGGSFDNVWPTPLADAAPKFRAWAAHVAGAGALDRHYIYADDEPRPGDPRVTEVTRMLHGADPRLRTLVTLGEQFDPAAHAEWLRGIDIVCLRNVVADAATTDALRAMGKTLWLYASGPKPPYPTLVIDYPAMAARILPWTCWKLGATGLLYWSVNYWTRDPYRHAQNTRWGDHGNGLLWYPGPDGPVPSIRLEVLRDGMDDYDYLAMLADEVARVDALGAPASEPAGALDGADDDVAAPIDIASHVAQARQLLSLDGVVESSARYTPDPDRLLSVRRRIAEQIITLRRIR